MPNKVVKTALVDHTSLITRGRLANAPVICLMLNFSAFARSVLVLAPG
jgi:hypothetical protein